jgi:hypothetical protein
LDVTARIRTNVVAQSIVLTRTMDYWGRTAGVSIVLPYLYVESSSGSDRTAVHGVSDIGFLWQMNIFGGPALSREAFASFVPQTFSSVHLFLGTPLGDYAHNRHLPRLPQGSRKGARLRWARCGFEHAVADDRRRPRKGQVGTADLRSLASSSRAGSRRLVMLQRRQRRDVACC